MRVECIVYLRFQRGTVTFSERGGGGGNLFSFLLTGVSAKNVLPVGANSFLFE